MHENALAPVPWPILPLVPQARILHSADQMAASSSGLGATAQAMIYCLFSSGRSARRAHFHLLNTYHYKNILSSFSPHLPGIFWKPYTGTYTICSSATWTSTDRYPFPPQPLKTLNPHLLFPELTDAHALGQENPADVAPVRQTKQNLEMIAYTESACELF